MDNQIGYYCLTGNHAVPKTFITSNRTFKSLFLIRDIDNQSHLKTLIDWWQLYILHLLPI